MTPIYGHKLKNQIPPKDGPYSMLKLFLPHSIAFGVILEDLRPF